LGERTAQSFILLITSMLLAAWQSRAQKKGDDKNRVSLAMLMKTNVEKMSCFGLLSMLMKINEIRSFSRDIDENNGERLRVETLMSSRALLRQNVLSDPAVPSGWALASPFSVSRDLRRTICSVPIRRAGVQPHAFCRPLSSFPVGAATVYKRPLRPSKCKNCHLVREITDTLSVRRRGE
jgi:hypothetical protein